MLSHKLYSLQAISARTEQLHTLYIVYHFAWSRKVFSHKLYSLQAISARAEQLHTLGIV